MYVIQWVRSLIFNISMYLMMAVLAIAFLIPMLIERRLALYAMHLYCRYVIWSARILINLHVEIRGTPPSYPALVAAKHQSFFDILVIFGALPRPRFIMKHILIYTPFLGQYAKRIGSIPVKRKKRGQAIKQMVEDAANNKADAGQLVIYPQGTRVPPGEYRKYKIGIGILYEELGQPCVPVATNIGQFWPKRGVYRHAGHAVVEFLPPIDAGLPTAEFMTTLEQQIESKSNTLMGLDDE